MVVSYEGGTKSLPVFWFVSGFLSASCGQRQRCACVRAFVWVWVWGDGNGCVVGEKVTNAGGRACLGKFFSLSFFPLTLCFRPENREEIQTKITPVPLPEKCAPAPRRYPLCSEGKVTLRQLGGDEGEFAGSPPGAWIPGTVPLLAPLIFIKACLNIFLCF